VTTFEKQAYYQWTTPFYKTAEDTAFQLMIRMMTMMTTMTRTTTMTAADVRLSQKKTPKIHMTCTKFHDPQKSL